MTALTLFPNHAEANFSRLLSHPLVHAGTAEMSRDVTDMAIFGCTKDKFDMTGEEVSASMLLLGAVMMAIGCKDLGLEIEQAIHVLDQQVSRPQWARAILEAEHADGN